MKITKFSELNKIDRLKKRSSIAMVHSIYQKIVVVLLLVLNPSIIYGIDGVDKVQLKIAIIGAGPGGLFSAKHSLAHGHHVTVYEQSDEIGGIWVLHTNGTENRFELNIHTAMYKGLK